MAKVQIYETIRKTPGRFHSWVRSNVGIIRKPNNKIIEELRELVNEKLEIMSDKPVIIEKKQRISWWMRLWRFLRSKLK